MGIELINRKKEAAEQIKLRNRILESQRSVQELIGNEGNKLAGSGAHGEDCDEDDFECLTEGKDFIR